MSRLLNNKGAIFVTVSIVLTIIFIFLSMLLAVVSTEVRISQSFADGNKAYYICESGANFAINHILSQRDVMIGYSEVKDYHDNVFPQPDYTSDYSIRWEVIENNFNTAYTITSVGSYGKYTRKLRVSFEIDTGSRVLVNEWRLEEL